MSVQRTFRLGGSCFRCSECAPFDGSTCPVNIPLHDGCTCFFEDVVDAPPITDQAKLLRQGCECRSVPGDITDCPIHEYPSGRRQR